MPQDPKNRKPISRRSLLTRAGLAAGALYMAPAMVGLNAAHASTGSGSSSGSSSSGPSSSSNSGPSRSGNSSSDSRNSGPSRSSQRVSGETPLWLKKLFPGM